MLRRGCGLARPRPTLVRAWRGGSGRARRPRRRLPPRPTSGRRARNAHAPRARQPPPHRGDATPSAVAAWQSAASAASSIDNTRSRRDDARDPVGVQSHRLARRLGRELGVERVPRRPRMRGGRRARPVLARRPRLRRARRRRPCTRSHGGDAVTFERGSPRSSAAQSCAVTAGRDARPRQRRRPPHARSRAALAPSRVAPRSVAERERPPSRRSWVTMGGSRATGAIELAQPGADAIATWPEAAAQNDSAKHARRDRKELAHERGSSHRAAASRHGPEDLRQRLCRCAPPPLSSSGLRRSRCRSASFATRWRCRSLTSVTPSGLAAA